jgi:two-component system, OmpR family, response regulator MprA
MGLEHRPRALVIDDDAAMREMVVCMLDFAGFEAEAAVDADQALFALQARPYAVAVCDLHMPRRDGLAFTRAAHWIRPGTPVVLMTSFACDRTRADGSAAGAAGLLSKPFSIRELREAIGEALARAERS